MGKKPLTDEQALAWIYLKMGDFVDSMPTALGDLIGDPPDGYDDVYEVVGQADKYAKKILKTINK